MLLLLRLLFLLLLLLFLLQVPARPDNVDAKLGRDGTPVRCQRGGAQLLLPLLLRLLFLFLLFLLFLLLLLLFLLLLLLQVPARHDNVDAKLGRDGIPVRCQREGGVQLPQLPLTPLHNNPLLHNPHQQEGNTQQPPSGDNPSKLSLRTIPGA